MMLWQRGGCVRSVRQSFKGIGILYHAYVSRKIYKGSLAAVHEKVQCGKPHGRATRVEGGGQCWRREDQGRKTTSGDPCHVDAYYRPEAVGARRKKGDRVV